VDWVTQAVADSISGKSPALTETSNGKAGPKPFQSTPPKAMTKISHLV
jgi:hypothetical protein